MYSLSERLRTAAGDGLFPVIPDVKLCSPAEGELMRGRDPVKYARSLLRAGAPALSVVTESRWFGGSLALLERVAAAAKAPVLRKDFITAKQQVLETARAGAAAVLLIAAMLDEAALGMLFEAALESGLEPLVETHSEAEIRAANRLPLTLIGINNRDILRMERDGGCVSATVRLAAAVRPGPLIVSESAIASAADARGARRAGAHAALVGTALLKAQNAPRLLREMMGCELLASD